MKKLKELKGVKLLSKTEQKTISGGKMMCLWGEDGMYCLAPFIACVEGICVFTMPELEE